MTAKPDLTGLTPGERKLVTSAAAGEIAELGPRQPVRAALIVALACGEPFEGREAPFSVVPPGLVMQGGAVRGRLDFSYRRVRLGLSINDASIPKGVDLTQARMRDVLFDSCRIGGLLMRGARIEGAFSACNAQIDGGRDDALYAQSAEIGSGLFLNGAVLKGCCAIAGAKIAGQISAIGAHFDNGPKGKYPGGDALFAQSVEIGGGLFLRNAVLKGRCAVIAARVAGQFAAEGAKFDNGPQGEHPGGDALRAQSAEIGAGLLLNGAVLKGRCDINATKITGPFVAEGASFDNGPQGKHPGGVALHAERAEITGGLWLRPLPGAPGEVDKRPMITGTINLTDASLPGGLRIIGAHLSAPAGVALRAPGLRAGKVWIPYSTIDGAVTAPRALIEGELDLRDSKLTCAALARERSDNPLPAALEGTHPSHDTTALDLSEARIAHLILPGTEATRPRGIVNLMRAHAVSFEDSAAAWPAALNPKTKACATRECDKSGAADIDHLILDGFTYDRLVNPSGDGESGDVAAARKRWLLGQHRDHVFKHFRPQPWRQLALALARQGHEDEARRIAIERRVMSRMASDTPILRRALSWLLHVLADYGFNPWKTMVWSAGIVALCAAVYFTPIALGHCGEPWCDGQQAYVRVQPDDFVTISTPETDEAEGVLTSRYPHFNPVLYSLDAFIPILDLGSERYWRANDNYGAWTIDFGFWRWRGSWGQALHWLYIVQQIVGAILIALTITGFTGLLTREDRD